MDTKRENFLLPLIKDKQQREILLPLIQNLIYIEQQLQDIRRLPLLRVSGDRQKITAAGRLLQQLTQQQNALTHTLLSATKRETGNTGEESPLRAYLRHMQEQNQTK